MEKSWLDHHVTFCNGGDYIVLFLSNVQLPRQNSLAEGSEGIQISCGERVSKAVCERESVMRYRFDEFVYPALS